MSTSLKVKKYEMNQRFWLLGKSTLWKLTIFLPSAIVDQMSFGDTSRNGHFGDTRLLNLFATSLIVSILTESHALLVKRALMFVTYTFFVWHTVSVSALLFNIN